MARLASIFNNNFSNLVEQLNLQVPENSVNRAGQIKFTLV